MKLFHSIWDQINCDLSDGKKCKVCKVNKTLGIMLIITAVVLVIDVSLGKILSK